MMAAPTTKTAARPRSEGVPMYCMAATMPRTSRS